jgi:hypothetical protein
MLKLRNDGHLQVFLKRVAPAAQNAPPLVVEVPLVQKVFFEQTFTGY